MITCSKCNKAFNFDWQNISKDSTIQCIHCGNECLVKLFDLEKMPSDNDEGFSGINDINPERSIETEEKIQIHSHLIIIMFCFVFFVILFILGMYKISYIEQEIPILAKFYNKIRVFAKKSIAISSISTEQDEHFMTVDLNLINLSDNPEVLSDIQVLILDSFHNAVAGTHISPHKIIKTTRSMSIKINIREQNSDNLRNIRIFINGKVALEKSLPI